MTQGEFLGKFVIAVDRSASYMVRPTNWPSNERFMDQREKLFRLAHGHLTDLEISGGQMLYDNPVVQAVVGIAFPSTGNYDPPSRKPLSLENLWKVQLAWEYYNNFQESNEILGVTSARGDVRDVPKE